MMNNTTHPPRKREEVFKKTKEEKEILKKLKSEYKKALKANESKA